MGKGDKKSRKGKRWIGSYGVSRNRKAIKARLKRSASKKVGGPKVEAGPKVSKARKMPRKKSEG